MPALSTTGGARKIPAAAQPAFLQASWPAVHKLPARDLDGSHAKRRLHADSAAVSLTYL